MKKVAFTVSAIFVCMSASAFAAQSNNKFSGKCEQQAVSAAVNFWADVPNPSETLEYQPVSANPIKAGSNVYDVVLAFGDQGDYLGATTYQVTFADYSNCSKPAVIALPAGK